MPVSHIGLTVSHLPTSCSFFLSALQPLGYRFIGQQGNQIGLGIKDADFFLCQETPGIKAGAAHIAFTAPSRAAVRDFYAAALNAGGRPNGAPACRDEGSGHFNAAVLDFDGNSIEVVFRDEPDVRDDGTVVEHSRVLTWQNDVAESARDDKSVVSSRTAHSVSKQALLPAATPSKAPSLVSAASTLSKAASMIRSVSAPVTMPQVSAEVTTTTRVTAAGDASSKKIIGTLLGAAAGAAVAYAMVKSEEDSAKKEAKFEAFLRAKEAAAQLSIQEPQQVYETQSKSVHNDSASQSPTPQQRSVYAPRAIEPAPASYYAPAYTSYPATQAPSERRAIEYAPAYSIAPSRTQFLSQRSVTSPELTTPSKAHSTVSKTSSRAPSAIHSTAPSTLISSFVPDAAPRRSSTSSIHSYHSTKSKHTSPSSHHSKSRSTAPSPPPSAHHQSKAASIVGSILGRDSGSSSASKKDKQEEDFEIEELTDTDTVAPSDSISNAGSSSRRSHRSHKHRSSSSSKHSSHSVVSSSSKHSKRSSHSHSSKRSHRHHSTPSPPSPSPLSNEYKLKSEIISEPSDASTVRPYKGSASAVSKSKRKDSGMYEEGFDTVQYGAGSVRSLPVRGITQSMVDGDGAGEERERGGKGVSKSLMSGRMGKMVRAFEGA